MELYASKIQKLLGLLQADPNLLYSYGFVSVLILFFSFPFSVQSCLHIMDMCQSKSNSYDLLSRNKALSMRPVTLPSTTNMSVAFNKIACIHSQVSHCLHRAMCIMCSILSIRLRSHRLDNRFWVSSVGKCCHQLADAGIAPSGPIASV